jgi:DNA polymerase III epsilon subunit-like protein
MSTMDSINAGKPWTKEEDTLLSKLYNEDKLDLEQISKIHARAIGGIVSRLVKNKIVKDRKMIRGYDKYFDDKSKTESSENASKPKISSPKPIKITKPKNIPNLNLWEHNSNEYFTDGFYVYQVKKIKGDLVGQLQDQELKPFLKSTTETISLIDSSKNELALFISSPENETFNQYFNTNKQIKVLTKMTTNCDYYVCESLFSFSDKCNELLNTVYNSNLPLTQQEKVIPCLEIINSNVKENGQLIIYDKIEFRPSVKAYLESNGYTIILDLVDESNQTFKIHCVKKIIKINGNIMILDTETTGIPYSRNPKELFKFNDARLIELGYIIYDKNGKKIKEFDTLIKPKDFVINNSEIHGITNDQAKNTGKTLEDTFKIFTEDLQTVEVLVGHNIGFDISILQSEAYRNKNNLLYDLIENKNKQCTMEMGKKFYKMDKNPKLVDLYKISTGKEIIQDHRALSDCLMCADCYYKMVG